MKKPIKNILLTTFVAASIAAPLSAFANPPHLPNLVQYGNRWTITFYDDSSPLHNQWATQGICFYRVGVVGTHERYIWISDTYPDWNGRATQEGDQIFMHGDFQWPWGTPNGGHDGMEWEIVSLKEGAGHWKEWVEYGRFGTTIGFGNAKLVRVGNCTNPGFDTADTAYEANAKLAIPRNPDGTEQNNPMGISNITVQE